MVEKIKLDAPTISKNQVVGNDSVGTVRDGVQLVLDAIDSNNKKTEMEKRAEKVTEVGAPDLGNVVRIWNEDGSVRFGDLFDETPGRPGMNFRIVNKKGTVEFRTSPASRSSWFGTSSLFKLAMFGGMAYIYREELKILGRGVMSGARLAIERWNEKERERERDRDIAAGIDELADLPFLADDDFYSLKNSTTSEGEEQGKSGWLFRGAIGAELEDSIAEGKMWDSLQGEESITLGEEDVEEMDIGVRDEKMIPGGLRKTNEDNERLTRFFEEREKMRESERLARMEREVEDDELLRA
jgi:hypothetical protein